MRFLFSLLLVCSAAAFGADSDYNGRWDITAHTKPRPRAWWVELNGVGTPGANGKFVSAYAGDMNKIDSISVQDGVLKFVIKRPGRGNAAGADIVYTAKLVNGKLDGTQMVEGQKNAPLPWTGVRAPVIKDKDDGTWKEGKPIALFNGKDLTGWKGLVPGAEVKWTVEDGVLKNAPPTTDIISDQSFWNFKLHMDFRIREHSNSGIGLRGRYEIQILDDYGKPAGTHGAAALYSRIAPTENASKPAGEWQSYDIRLVGRTLTIVHNGKKVLDKVEVEGLTAIANNPDEGEPGPFIVQGDHSYVEIKSFVVTPLTK
jgi:hypothetical protein